MHLETRGGYNNTNFSSKHIKRSEGILNEEQHRLVKIKALQKKPQKGQDKDPLNWEEIGWYSLYINHKVEKREVQNSRDLFSASLDLPPSPL